MPIQRLLSQFRIIPKFSFKPRKSLGIQNLKTKIEDANSFYKRLVGMEKVEQHRSNMIHLKDQLSTVKENLNQEKSLLNLTQQKLIQLDGKISKLDRVREFERYVEMLKEEKELKLNEEQQIKKVKAKEGQRDAMYLELDSTKTTVLMLESDHNIYNRYLRYLFSAMAFISTVLYMSDSKKILNGIEEIKKMNRMVGGSTWDYVWGVVWWGTCEGVKKTGRALGWCTQKSFSGIQWFASKSGSAIATSAKWTGSAVYWSAEKTGSGVKWAACGGYNLVMNLWRDPKAK